MEAAEVLGAERASPCLEGARGARMRLSVRTVLGAPAARVWDEVRLPRLWLHVSAPLLAFDPIDPPELPETWIEGRYRVRMRLFGVLPIGHQWVVTSLPRPEDHERGVYRIRDEGSGDIVQVWDHRVVIRARDDGRTGYRDDVEVRAGLWTPLVWAFAHVFYRYRQARWRALARRSFRYPAGR
jgi:hypothetical protein